MYANYYLLLHLHLHLLLLLHLLLCARPPIFLSFLSSPHAMVAASHSCLSCAARASAAVLTSPSRSCIHTLCVVRIWTASMMLLWSFSLRARSRVLSASILAAILLSARSLLAPPGVVVCRCVVSCCVVSCCVVSCCVVSCCVVSCCVAWFGVGGRCERVGRRRAETEGRDQDKGRTTQGHTTQSHRQRKESAQRNRVTRLTVVGGVPQLRDARLVRLELLALLPRKLLPVLLLPAQHLLRLAHARLQRRTLLVPFGDGVGGVLLALLRLEELGARVDDADLVLAEQLLEHGPVVVSVVSRCVACVSSVCVSFDFLGEQEEEEQEEEEQEEEEQERRK